MKKVVIVAIIAIALGVVLFIFISDFFERQQLETRCDELGGLICGTSGAVQTALYRQWWHPGLPADSGVYEPPESEMDPEPLGQVEWYQHWQDQNQSFEGQIVRYTQNVQFPEMDRTDQAKEGRKVTWVWHIGVPDSDFGQRIPMLGYWVFHEGYWKLYRLFQTGDAVDGEAPPIKDPRKG